MCFACYEPHWCLSEGVKPQKHTTPHRKLQLGSDAFGAYPLKHPIYNRGRTVWKTEDIIEDKKTPMICKMLSSMY